MSIFRSRTLTPYLALLLAPVACGLDVEGPVPEGEISSLEQAITTLTVSGKVRDASGKGIAGVTVTLSGTAQGTRVTDATGSYAFTSLRGGSYSLRPAKTGCAITPEVVNLNNLTASKTVNFAGSGSGCAAAGTPKALILVDQRLQSLLATELEQYRAAASARRGFGIELRALSHVDDWSAEAVRTYVKDAKAANPALEGVLYVGNIKLPSFYKARVDIRNTRLYPAYLEDLDATFTRVQTPGSVDPTCDGTNAPNCVVGEPGVVPPHDLDNIVEGAQEGPELWAAFMPVGVAGTSNGYSDFANQLRPYLTKVRSFYAGQLVTNRRYYVVGNGIGERFGWAWDAYGGASIDFYGKPGPQGQTGAACLSNGQNLCYQRWATETFASAAAFEEHYSTFPWVGEDWQTSDIYSAHMNASLYDVVDVTTHANETWSLVSSDQARALTKAGLIVALSGCSVAGFAQPYSPSTVDTSVLASENLPLSYLYGSSKAIAALGDPSERGHYANYPLIYRELRVNRAYLGKAHRARMMENYARASDAVDLEAWASEMLLGDPFMDLN